MIRQYELVEKVRAYDPGVDEDLLNKAYVFAMKAHGKQKRASGDPYFSHPLEVAGILTGMKLDSATIATALLHDVIEDTLATHEQIEAVFGKKILELVDGVTKLSKIELQMHTEVGKQAENFRKFLLAMSNDIRVLLVKLADRLHNMRTLHHIKKVDKRRRIALETVEIYAPLAERLGIHELKDELENLSFAQLDPEAMQSITSRLEFMLEHNPTLETDMVKVLESLMKKSRVECQIRGRIKKPYSIWRKLDRQNLTFEQLSDVLAYRIIVNDVTDCYRALGVIHQTYSVIPGRFKDYISVPKPNFYRSIHTTVLGPDNQRLEVQIRTQRMHQEAEYGVAAHWQYKEQADNKEGTQFGWVQELLEILDHADDPEEFLENTKLAMYTDRVFCFTPKGKLIALPRGATPVDFAYAVHTEVGDQCVGAKVNGRMVPLRHQLANGDQVMIATSKTQIPSSRWENFVVTGKARSAIRRRIRQQRRDEYRELGKRLIEKACSRNGLDFSSKVMQEAATRLMVQDSDMISELVGQGTLDEEEVLRAVFPDFKEDERHRRLPTVHKDWESKQDTVIPIYGLSSAVAVHFCEQCHPVRGDRIVGIKIPDKGVDIHRIECSSLEDFDDRQDLWLDLAWQESGEDKAYYVGRMRLEVVNEMGALATITSTVAKGGANISNLQIPERDPGFYVMLVDVEVRDIKHLNDIAKALRVNKLISNVDRVFH